MFYVAKKENKLISSLIGWRGRWVDSSVRRMAVEGDDVYLRSVMDEEFAIPSMDFDDFTFGELDGKSML